MYTIIIANDIMYNADPYNFFATNWNTKICHIDVSFNTVCEDIYFCYVRVYKRLLKLKINLIGKSLPTTLKFEFISIVVVA